MLIAQADIQDKFGSGLPIIMDEKPDEFILSGIAGAALHFAGGNPGEEGGKVLSNRRGGVRVIVLFGVGGEEFKTWGYVITAAIAKRTIEAQVGAVAQIVFAVIRAKRSGEVVNETGGGAIAVAEISESGERTGTRSLARLGWRRFANEHVWESGDTLIDQRNEGWTKAKRSQVKATAATALGSFRAGQTVAQIKHIRGAEYDDIVQGQAAADTSEQQTGGE